MGYIGLSGKGSSIIHIRRNVTKNDPSPLFALLSVSSHAPSPLQTFAKLMWL